MKETISKQNLFEHACFITKTCNIQEKYSYVFILQVTIFIWMSIFMLSIHISIVNVISVKAAIPIGKQIRQASISL